MKTMLLCYATPDKRRPDWRRIMYDCGGAKLGDNEMVAVTRGTLKCASTALRTINAAEYYHNNGSAEAEVLDALAESLPGA